LNKIIAGNPFLDEILMLGIEPADDLVRLSLFYGSVKKQGSEKNNDRKKFD
jgi:hypothetical protein